MLKSIGYPRLKAGGGISATAITDKQVTGSPREATRCRRLLRHYCRSLGENISLLYAPRRLQLRTQPTRGNDRACATAEDAPLAPVSRLGWMPDARFPDSLRYQLAFVFFALDDRAPADIPRSWLCGRLQGSNPHCPLLRHTRILIPEGRAFEAGFRRVYGIVCRNVKQRVRA